MATLDSKQMVMGKSFEYALITQFEEKLKKLTKLEVIKNSSFRVAKTCFDSITSLEQSQYLLTASFAVNFLMDIEPRLSNGISKDDILQLEILPDFFGIDGDVRDVLALRLLQKWEIGVSAKNNHQAVKHSRLSGSIDFCEKWLGSKASVEYFKTVRPIFDNLAKIKKESNSQKKWSDLGNYHNTIYVPVLKAFIKEMKKNYKKDPAKMSAHLISYLVGNKDFYKVIKSNNGVEIHAYNLNGTLNLPFEKILPKYKTPKVPLPTKILSISFKKGSNTTVIIKMNNGWSLSFRIHNASSRVEPSLKFDINLLESPKELFKNTLNINQN